MLQISNESILYYVIIDIKPIFDLLKIIKYLMNTMIRYL